MFRRLLMTAVSCLVLISIAATALAGGWATSILQTPDEFEAGATYDITYTVLQHGETPIVGETALLFSRDGSQPLRFVGTPTKVPGEYLVTVELPSAGSWLIEVDQAGFGVVEYDLVEVAGADVLSVPSGVLAIAAVVVAAGLMAFAVRRLRQGSGQTSPIASEM